MDIEMELIKYQSLLDDIKARIRSAQVRAALSVNSEMILLYWQIGKTIAERQLQEGWSAKVIPRLANDLKNEFAELKGYSERNLGYMLRFANEYPDVAILQQAVANLPWGHNILLIEKLKDKDIRLWYVQQCIENQWSRDVLDSQIKNQLHLRQGKAISNFRNTMPLPQSDLAQQALKDPYIFDFLTLAVPFRERDVENQLVQHVSRFLLELGKGFALRDINKPMGISEYLLPQNLPENLKSSLPTIEEIENQLNLIDDEIKL